jgi:hypothetical protein
VTRAVQVAVVPNAHTKVIFGPPIPVRVGEPLFLQVLNIERAPLAVYFSDRDQSPARSYLWCPQPAERCVHPHDLNAIVYGWARPS